MPTRTTPLHLCSIGIALLVLAAPVQAQQPEDKSQPSWKRQFDEVEVKQVNPDELPSAEESLMPSALAAKSALPRAVSLETLRRSAIEISPFVVGVVVVPGSDSPVRQSEIVVQGEAIWVSGKDKAADPVLVTNAHYLKDARSVFVRVVPTQKSGAMPHVQRRSLREMSLGADVKAVLADKSLIKATVEHVDKHRNLAVLRVPEERLPTPKSGLAFFPIEEQAASAAYGFSHQMGSTLVVTQFLAPRKSRKQHLAYYLHTNFPVILGAPIVAPDGRVIATTAMRHPLDQDRTLVIPPRALRKYVEMVQAKIDEQNAKNDEESP